MQRIERPKLYKIVAEEYDLSQTVGDDRFVQLNRFLSARANAFFEAPRLSESNTRARQMRMAFLQGALKSARSFREQEKNYQDWLNASAKDAADTAPVQGMLTPEKVRHLQSIGDLSVHTVAKLEFIRKQDFPNLETQYRLVDKGNDQKELISEVEGVFDIYDSFLTGLLGPTEIADPGIPELKAHNAA